MLRDARKLPLILKSTFAIVLAASMVAAIVSCGSSSSTFGGIARVVGQVFRPVTGTIASGQIPLVEAQITVRDFVDEQLARAARMTDAGTTDSEGNYAVDIDGQIVAAIIVTSSTEEGDIRISGLVNPNTENITKRLDGYTDVAAEAGLSAVDDGSIVFAQLIPERVNNLEAGAVEVLNSTNVDFFDPAQVSLAAQAVRALTNDGATAPGAAEATPTPEPEATTVPEPEAEPTNLPAPEASQVPEPEATQLPEATAEPEATQLPEATPEPEASQLPEPEPTDTAEPSPVPEATEEPMPHTATCFTTWAIASATLNGAPQDTYNGVWTISESSWTLDTSVCSASGTTSTDGTSISMTVSSTSCPPTLPAPEGRTASGTCTVADDGTITLTLSHEVLGQNFTLVTTGSAS